jgi:nicotinate-nucleotide--dimethylbenzimidazole phosphoribosyltransferase
MADIRALLSSLPAGDTEAEAAAARREATLTKPAGALGRLEELSRWLSAWQGRHPPRLERAMVCVFAANHGVARQGVSAYPAEVTRQMVANFRAGGAAINQLCRAMGAGLRIFEMDLDRPTEDFTAGPAMTERDFTEAFAVGLGAVDAGTDVLGLGEMGIANTTAAAALCHALFGGEAAQWTGPGTGVEGPGLARKAEVVARAVERNGVRGGDPLEALRAVGGREMVAIAGAVVGARLSHVPVLLDGYVCTSAAAALARAAPGALGHCRVAHVSAEPGHRMLLAHLGTSPLLDLGMRLGEGTGAALALSLLKGAVACHEGMATFAEAGVSGGSESD